MFIFRFWENSAVILFKNPEQNAGGFLFCSDFGRPNLRLGHIFGAPKFVVSPLEIPFLGLQNPKFFSRASRAGFYFVQKFPPRIARVFILFIFSSRFSRGFLFCSIFISQKPARVFIKGGGFIRWCLVYIMLTIIWTRSHRVAY